MKPLSYPPLKMPVPPPEPEYLFQPESTQLNKPSPLNHESFARFLESINLHGMGGAGFPTAQKIRAARQVKTLVINGVECEPGISIDQALLFHHSDWIRQGAETTARAIGAQEIILCVKQSTKNLNDLHLLYPYAIETLPSTYPSGAEKLIIKQLTGKWPPPKSRPHELGFLVQNVATLRAIGRALLDDIPLQERPLTLAHPEAGIYRNLIAPLGQTIGDLLKQSNCPYNPATQIIVAGGLMMGHIVSETSTIEQVTTSLVILPAQSRPEEPCIRCGACNQACPLQLHPVALTDRIKQGKTASNAFQTQLADCFLCGVCSAVCPSQIPLVHQLKEGKQCLK
jgi:Na+-translocating ferredoxin:NAD+ oxidoreductase subunit C